MTKSDGATILVHFSVIESDMVDTHDSLGSKCLVDLLIEMSSVCEFVCRHATRRYLIEVDVVLGDAKLL